MAKQTAWNLLFSSNDGLAKTPTVDDAVVTTVPARKPDGWAGSEGPGIDWKNWPRSTNTGLPMMHVLTLRLPQDFQRQGSKYPGIAFFAGEGQFAEEDSYPGIDSDSSESFLSDLAKAEEHPRLRRRRDIIDGEFALMWLTEEEIDGGPKAPLEDLRDEDDYEDESEGCNAWDQIEPKVDIYLVPRNDPNAGLAPQEVEAGESDPQTGYASPRNKDYDLLPWAGELYGMCHLGGTSFHVQGLPEGLTPWYLELEEIVGLNFGGDGNAQIDLESDTFDWACG